MKMRSVLIGPPDLSVGFVASDLVLRLAIHNLHHSTPSVANLEAPPLRSRSGVSSLHGQHLRRLEVSDSGRAPSLGYTALLNPDLLYSTTALSLTPTGR